MLDAPTRTLTPAPPMTVDLTQPSFEPESALRGTVAEELTVVVAPTTGRFRPLAHEGQLRAGELLGHVTGGRGRADEVRAPVDGEVRDLLVRAGQLVRRGQGLAWLQRVGEQPA